MHIGIARKTYRHQMVIAVMSTHPRRNMLWNLRKSTMVVLARVCNTSPGMCTDTSLTPSLHAFLYQPWNLLISPGTSSWAKAQSRRNGLHAHMFLDNPANQEYRPVQ